MDFELTPALEEIVRQVRALCERFGDEYWRQKDARREFPHDFYRAVAEAGYLGVAIPEQYGFAVTEPDADNDITRVKTFPPPRGRLLRHR
jgi:alkylation response protein AidB-like acyl-CoA dehydrogenase